MNHIYFLVTIILSAYLGISLSCTKGTSSTTLAQNGFVTSQSEMPVQEELPTKSTVDSVVIEEESSIYNPNSEGSVLIEQDVEAESSTCNLGIESPDSRHQLGGFTRWLRDQSVGRKVRIERIEPRCGNRDGYFIARTQLYGPAGGLQSLGRALEVYFPNSAWQVLQYERYDGDDYPLRLQVEIRIITGQNPRPRCTWDPNISCN